MPALEVAEDSSISPSKKARRETKPTEERAVLRFAKLSEHATRPTRGSSRAAGYDLYRFVILLIKIILRFIYDLMCAEQCYST